MRNGPPPELRGSEALRAMRAWDPSALLHVTLDGAALTA
jgi:hypothetical protein